MCNLKLSSVTYSFDMPLLLWFWKGARLTSFGACYLNKSWSTSGARQPQILAHMGKGFNSLLHQNSSFIWVKLFIC